MQRINSPFGHARRMFWLGMCDIQTDIGGFDATKRDKHATHAELMHFHLPGDQGFETGSGCLSTLPLCQAHHIPVAFLTF